MSIIQEEQQQLSLEKSQLEFEGRVKDGKIKSLTSRFEEVEQSSYFIRKAS